MERQRKREASMESFVMFWRCLYSKVKTDISCHLNLSVASSVRSFCKVPMVNWACNLSWKSIKAEFLIWIATVNSNAEERLPTQVNADYIKQDNASSFSLNGRRELILSELIAIHNSNSTKIKIQSLLSVIFICSSHLSFPMKLSPSRDKSVGSTDMR